MALVSLASASLFIAGATACYTLLMPYAFDYFVSSARESSVAMMPGIGSYLGFILTALVAFGLVFQIPLITGLLAAWDIVPVERLCRIRKYVIVAAFIVAAIATPPDAISQIAVAIPLIALYEISILSVKIFKRDRRAQCLQGPPPQQPADGQ